MLGRPGEGCAPLRRAPDAARGISVALACALASFVVDIVVASNLRSKG